MRKKDLLKLLLSSIALFCFFSSKAQKESSIIPPSPEAASFFKSTDIPVSMYTGIPNVGVDFYTIKTKELQIPIRINYNARGIQVAEMASRTGIGWALQYGGMISRQVRGLADESGQGILYHNYYNEVFTDPEARASLTTEITSNNIDEFPDQFFFDVNGESGKFIFDHNDGSVVLQKFDDIKIVPLFEHSGIVSWTVTDKLGNKYYYGRSKDGTRQAIDNDHAVQSYSFANLSGMKDLGSSQDHPNSAWHLMEIETYLHEKIEFNYELEEGVYFQRSYDKADSKNLVGDGNPMLEVRSFFSRNFTNQYQIKEIRFTGGKILFENEPSERKDFTNTHALHKISVLDDQDNLTKAYEFNYFYQRCVDDNNQLAYLKQIDTAANYHLFLSSIKEKNGSGDSLPPYRFEYDSILLPNRFSNSSDNWGYYNGKNNGQYLSFFDYDVPDNRQVDTAYSGAGLLQKMTYPTGGSTLFTYEQNRVKKPAFIDQLLVMNNNLSQTIAVGDALFKDTAYYANGIYSKLITIGTDKVPVTPVIFSFVTPMATDDYDPSVARYTVLLESLDGTTSIHLYPSETYRELNLQPGQYVLKVIPTDGFDPNAYGSGFIASLQWSITKPLYQLDSDEWFGAGKRIKRIEHRIGNDLVSFKEYEYKNSEGKTSGKTLGLPNFYFIQKVIPINGGIPRIDQYGSLPGSPLTQLQGNSVGYSRVSEYYGDSATNAGKTVCEFTNDEDAGDYYTFPYHLPVDMEWLRGRPLTTKIYKRNGSSYELQKSIENSYSYGGTTSANTFAGPPPFLHQDSIAPVFVYRKDRNSFYLPLFIFTPSDDLLHQQTFKVYYLTAGSFDLASVTETEYVNGTALTRKIVYGYNYPNHYQQVSQKTRTSRGDSSISTTYYPPDIIPRTIAEQKLIDQNRIAVPVRVEDSIKNSSNSLLASTIRKTVYKDWGNNLVLPELLQTSINNSPLVTELTYNKYDTLLGSPLELTPKSGVKEVYVWGYKKRYPVAKVVASDYNIVVGFVNQALLENASQYTDWQVRTELNKIRTGLAGTNTQVFSYTYRPMIGTTSTTDQRGQTASYIYDRFGRLFLIRDKDSNIVKKFDYHYASQPETALSCGTTAANWQLISSVCQLNSQGQNTGLQNITEKDMNLCSSTYGTTRTATLSNCIACQKLANWQSTGNYRCTKDANSHNTGYQEREEKDMESCSGTYNLTRWVSNGYSTNSCPLPSSCNSTACQSQGPDYKCINGMCEVGFMVITSQVYNSDTNTCTITYHYEWSDGSWSQIYTTSGPGPCFTVGG
jgi:hypothetical protein